MTESGAMELSAPRDRHGSFEPRLVELQQHGLRARRRNRGAAVGGPSSRLSIAFVGVGRIKQDEPPAAPETPRFRLFGLRA